MPIVHFAMKPRTVTHAQTASRTVAYLLRERDYAPTNEVGYLLRERGDVTDRRDLVWQQAFNVPAWAAGDAYRFFEAAATYERVNGRWALALEIALPRELSRAAQLALAEDFRQAHLADKTALIVLHEPRDQVTGAPQPHIHILMSTRTLDGIARDPAQHFARYNPADPARGGAQKDAFFNARQAPARLRVSYTDLANTALERAGQAVRLDPRSLVSRGIIREAEPRGVWGKDASGARATAQALRASLLPLEYAQAAAYWEGRKQVLGLQVTPLLAREAVVQATRHWTRQFTPGQQLPPLNLPARAAALTAEIAEMERVLGHVRLQSAVVQRDTREGRAMSWRQAGQLDTLLERAAQLSTPLRLPHMSLVLPGQERPLGHVQVPLRKERHDERGRDHTR